MKSLKLLTAFFLFFTLIVSAQEQTLIGSGEISHGGFGGPVIKYTQIFGEPALLIGGRGGWIINHTFVIGGGGYGLVTDIKKDLPPVYLVPTPFTATYLNFGYGGIELEYIIKSDELLHFSVHSLIGAGAVSYRVQELFNAPHYDNGAEYNYPSDAFFVFEPNVNAELNVISFMRISAGFSYRFISGANLDGLKDSDLDGPSGVMTFKFGAF